MSVKLSIEFISKKKLDKKGVKKIIDFLISKGVGFWGFNEKINKPIKVLDRAPCYSYSKNFGDLNYIFDENRKNPKIEDCINILSKYGGSIGMLYNTINFDLGFHQQKHHNGKYLIIYLNFQSKTQFGETGIERRENFNKIAQLSESLWEFIKPLYGEGGYEISLLTLLMPNEKTHNKESTVFDEILAKNMENIHGWILFFSKKLVKKIGKEKILNISANETEKQVKEFKDGSIRIIRYNIR